MKTYEASACILYINSANFTGVSRTRTCVKSHNKIGIYGLRLRFCELFFCVDNSSRQEIAVKFRFKEVLSEYKQTN